MLWYEIGSVWFEFNQDWSCGGVGGGGGCGVRWLVLRGVEVAAVAGDVLLISAMYLSLYAFYKSYIWSFGFYLFGLPV